MCPVMKRSATVARGTGAAAAGPSAAAASSTPDAIAPAGRHIRSATAKLHCSATP